MTLCVNIFIFEQVVLTPSKTLPSISLMALSGFTTAMFPFDFTTYFLSKRFNLEKKVNENRTHGMRGSLAILKNQLKTLSYVLNSFLAFNNK